MLTVFSVINLNDGGNGSLRQAILDCNSHIGADAVNFEVAGTIGLKSALPSITGQVHIDGTTAPGYEGTPKVELDFNNYAGLKFEAGSGNSDLRSLSLVDASASAVKLNGVGGMLIVGNYFGLETNGTTAIANRDSGILLVNSNHNVIGGDSAAERNVISGNKNHGIYASNSSTNTIFGNYIGTDASGTLDRGNIHSGIVLTDGSASNVVGGEQANVVSANKANGIYIKGSATANTVSGNIIGLNAAGAAALGNSLDGVKVESASGNLIGQSDPVTGVSYFTADVISVPVSGWQGLRGAGTDGNYLITGTSHDDALLYVGPINGAGGTAYTFQYPEAMNTSAYGPNLAGGETYQVVGSYKNSDYATAPVEVNGFIFAGTTDDLTNPENYVTIDYPGAKFNYAHSTSGGLVVGNYDSPSEYGTGGLPLGPGHAYIYDIASHNFLTDVVFPDSVSNSAYGIWYNGGTSYTIVGGHSTLAENNFDDQSRPFGQGYMVDYDSASGEFTHWKSFEYPNGVNFETHFEGISSVEKGVYTISADSVQANSSNPAQGSFVTVRRNTDGSLGDAQWVDITYTDPNTGIPSTGISSNDAVFGNQVVGIVIGSSTFSFQATINTGFQLSNVISGNLGNGIELTGASNNTVQMTYIGTDITGTADFGNAGNGILVTGASTSNLIGGEATGGNNPTADPAVIVTPPQGNLISGNNLNGVLINGKSTLNQLSGNFIGTDVTGNSALGNTKDGVAIDGANSNSLLGCTFQQDPFVFYNVISGNRGNGLSVNNSNDTTIQANFFGMGADNNTSVGNALNGVIVKGTSTRTTMGGPIPLGNVDAANGLNGIVVQDKASYFITYNTFCGVAAFSLNPDFGNGQDGMLITSTGGNNLIRTCVISRNGDDGVEISGSATGARVTGNIIGLNTDGLVSMGNLGNGVEIGGKAHDNIVGGPQPTFNIIPQNIIGSNYDNGVAIVGAAYNNTVSNGYIGTDVTGGEARGNLHAGVLLGSGSYNNTVGSADPTLPTLISGNHGNGIDMNGTTGNTVLGTLIGTDATGLLPIGNDHNGIHIVNSSKNLIGRTSSGPANLIAYNANDGVFVESGTGNGIRQNSIHSNTSLGIHLASGANLNQAAPVLTAVTATALGIQVTGTLTSKPKTTFTVEFFANDASAPSGRVYLGSQTVTTNSSGIAAFSWVGPHLPTGASYVTATATDAKNNTSQFSTAVS